MNTSILLIIQTLISQIFFFAAQSLIQFLNEVISTGILTLETRFKYNIHNNFWLFYEAYIKHLIIALLFLLTGFAFTYLLVYCNDRYMETKKNNVISELDKVVTRKDLLTTLKILLGYIDELENN